MNIAVIGTGNIGGRLARVWGGKGHRVFIGTRNPQADKITRIIDFAPERITAHSPAEAAGNADIILLAIPASAAFAAVNELGNVKGKVIVDAMNTVFIKPDPFHKTSEAIVAASGSSRIVKCFNWIGAENIDNPVYGDQVADMALCGNYLEDKSRVKQLAEDCGFNVYDIGGLDKEALLENAALLWGSLASGAGLGRNIAFKILRR